MTTTTSNVIGNGLSWVVVEDLKKSVEFYTKTVGMEIVNRHAEFFWAELAGPEGVRLGITEKSDLTMFDIGKNAIVVIEVTDIEEARNKLIANGSVNVGEIRDVHGHSRLLTFKDLDGNAIQLAEKLE